MNVAEQLGFEPIWLQIMFTKLILHVDKKNSTVFEVSSEQECNDMYIKLFYWKDHQKVTDNDVKDIKNFLISKFDLKFNPGIRVQDCKMIGYPIVFYIQNNREKIHRMYITYDGNIKICNNLKIPALNEHSDDEGKHEDDDRTGVSSVYYKDKSYCLRYNENFHSFKYWKHEKGNTTLDPSCNLPKYDLPARNNNMNDNNLVLLHFLCDNNIPDKLVEFWDDDLYISWDVVRDNKKTGMAQKKELIISDLIKGLYKSMHYSDNYINKCLVKYTENTELDLTMNLETFINSEQGIKCKQEVPNKTVGYVYNLDFSNFLI